MNSAYAVVTGASRGLGKAIAIELARKNIPLILVSSSDKISIVASEIKEQYQVNCIAIVCDLTQEENVLSLANQINEYYDVFLLVNNAGLGGTQPFEIAPIDYVNAIIQLNVMATSILTRQLISNLLRQKRSYILNVSSMAAFSPIGYKMVYPASKAFIRSFSLGLNAEFKSRGLSVSVVAPGAMATSPDIVRRINGQGFWGRLTLVAPEKVARKSICQTLKGRKEIVVNPLSYFFSQIVPQSIRTFLLTRVVRRETLL